MGEVVLRRDLKEYDDVVVTSAGLSDEEHGNPIDRRAQAVLTAAGYELPRRHFAHRASDSELEEADLILAMTVGHARLLRRRMEELGLGAGAGLERVHLWREFDGTVDVAPGGVFGEGGVLDARSRGRAGDSRRGGWGAGGEWGGRGQALYSSSGQFDVPDPWYGDMHDFEETLKVVERGSRGVAEYLQAARS